MTTETYFSTNEEEYRFDDLQEALEDAWDSSDEADEMLIVWQGECTKQPASHYAPDILEYMGERAYDDIGEFAEGWPDFKPEVAKALQANIEALIDDWAKVHKQHPAFGHVCNTKELQFKIVKQAEYFSDAVIEPITE